MMTFNFQNSYLDLPTIFYSTVNPTPIKAPKLLQLNHALLNDLNLGSYSEENDLHFLSGNKVSLGSTPMAQAYAGHQFGHFNNLGDGRAILLGEHLDAKKNRFDIQLKGSGPTPYSRRGDGRAALSPMLREYLISEAMHAFGIPTTRSLAVIATGEPVFRETALPGAILVRVAKSHLRVGTFQFAAFRCELKD